jgi:hypothetical protein
LGSKRLSSLFTILAEIFTANVEGKNRFDRASRDVAELFVQCYYDNDAPYLLTKFYSSINLTAKAKIGEIISFLDVSVGWCVNGFASKDRKTEADFK